MKHKMRIKRVTPYFAVKPALKISKVEQLYGDIKKNHCNSEKKSEESLM